jgi:hypothetical protein
MNTSLILSNNNDSLSLDCDSNSTSPKSLFCLIDPQLRKIEVLTMTIELVLSLIGNSLVILTILLRRYSKPKNRRFKKNKINRMDFFILQLSLADLYVSLGNILTMVTKIFLAYLAYSIQKNLFILAFMASKYTFFWRRCSLSFSNLHSISYSLLFCLRVSCNEY